jgi:hypothetical protein
MPSKRRAHQVVGEVSQVLESGLPPLHTSNKCQIKGLEEGRHAISHQCGLPPQGCATSPRGAHLPMPMCSNLIAISSINPQSNWIFSL